MRDLNTSKNDPRVLVLQNGARHNYAIPTVLERSGLLEAFYTDAVGTGHLERRLHSLCSIGLRSRRLQRLFKRQLPPKVAERTVSFPVSSCIDSVIGTKWTEFQLLRQGLGSANVVYSSLGWGRPLLQKARKRRIPVVVEMYVRPSIWKTYQAEFRRYPTWEEELPLRDCEGKVGTQRDPCLNADFIVVPAAGVGEDVVREHAFPPDNILVVPYGVGNEFFEFKNQPVPGRVLFAGSCSIGKGIHYFAMAAEELAKNNDRSRFEFVAAGQATRRVQEQPPCRYVTFLGRLPRGELLAQLQTADVFVLPSLSEGSALVTYEALAAGVPVITTQAAGSVVRDGLDGRIVPERNPQAIAAAIKELVQDRAKRDCMARSARARAFEFTWERYGERLIAALRHALAHSNPR